MQLTPKQARFAEEYVLDHNAAAAALRAGFAPNSARVTACRLLKANRAVQAAVEAQEALVAAEMGVSRQRVLRELQRAVALARQKGDPAAMIAGWREIGRMCGFYAPDKVRVGHDLAPDEGSPLPGLSDDALQAIIDDGRPLT